MMVIVKVRGNVRVQARIKRALTLLKLTKVNQAVLARESGTLKGSLRKVQEYVTFGEINEETLTRLLSKRGRLEGDKRVTEAFLQSKGYHDVPELSKAILKGEASVKELGMKSVFKLKAPSKGYGRQGIKKPFMMSGALGYRGEKINELLARML